MERHTRWVTTALTVIAAGLLATACGNGPRTTTISSTRFEVATASVVLGAKQLLVDTSNGDVWVLEEARSDSPKWVLLARGPEDVRAPEVSELLSPDSEEEDL